MRAALIILALFAIAAEKPNVVIILADDLGAVDLGCYGSKYHRTPNLDRFAAGAMKFDAAYAACPVCSPTRAALMTGLAPARLQLTDWLPGRGGHRSQRLLRPELPMQLARTDKSLPRLFKKAGYTTGHIGKWHLGGAGFGPLEFGFDSNIAGDHTGTPLSYFAPFAARGRTMTGLEQAPAGEYLTDRLTTEAERFIEANKQGPFLLYLAHYAVHTPLTAKPDMIAKYDKTSRPGQQSNPIYAAMIESLDDSVGRVLKKLEELKLDRQTIVVFTSDNGGLATEGPGTPATCNAPLREGKGYLYEGGIRVPLIVHAPGATKAGTTSKFPVISHDLLPTLATLCGILVPNNFDGSSLVALLDGQEAPERDGLYWHYPHYWVPGVPPGGAVRAGDLKLIEYYETGRRELYDLKADPGESRNLAGERPAEVERLAKKLDLWRKEVGARTMTANPNYAPNPQAADGTILLHSRFADVHGTQLRFEPLPHKDTLGCWFRVDDWASWEFTVTKPGQFTVEVWQGCGPGQGGSTVNVDVGGQTLTFNVEETRGFQDFKPRSIGTVTIATAGRHTLALKPKVKAKDAVMDVRRIVLKPN